MGSGVERAVGGGVLADPKGLTVGVDGLEMDGAGRTSGDDAELDGSLLGGFTGGDGAAESQGKKGQEQGGCGQHDD